MPGNSALTIPGRLGKNTEVPSGTFYLVDTAVVNNLPQGISVNPYLVHPKGNVVLVIMINHNNHNVWAWELLLAAEFFWVQHIPLGYGVELHQEGDKIEVVFQPFPMADIMASVKAIHNEPEKVPSKEASPEPYPTFRPNPNTQVTDFDFRKEIEHLPFNLNLGDVSLDREHQAKIY